ncbi:MAG: hypothetical protein CL569_10945 [Alphaproteobacteria bacterium]|nr:hypothetical protein [Alphaproteobacteria bacterium]
MNKKSGNISKSATNAEIDAFIQKVALTPATASAGERGRLIFALDATASREPTWDQACQIQGHMFLEAASVGGLDIQMVYYRGFGEFHASDWLSDSDQLVRQMTRVFCLGGQTQIAKVLRHAIAEGNARKVNALVFVGDCMEESVDELCQLAGELGILGVPTFIFQEGGEPIATRAFKQIARLTGGAHCRFDASSANQLRDLLSAVAVFAAGGRKALESFSKRAGRDVLLIAQQVK